MYQLPLLPNLRRLNLSQNRLEEFPLTVSSVRNQALLPQLRYLNLQSNNISCIPDQNTKLTDLEELIISKNRILNLPDKFLTNLTSLKILDGSRNELSEYMQHCTCSILQYIVHARIRISAISANMSKVAKMCIHG